MSILVEQSYRDATWDFAHERAAEMGGGADNWSGMEVHVLI